MAGVTTVKVRIENPDPEADFSEVTEVLANGTELSRVEEGSPVWYGRISVQPDSNSVNVVANGDAFSISSQVDFVNELPFMLATELLLDEENNRLIKGDSLSRQIVSVDIATGKITPIIGNDDPSALERSWGMTWAEVSQSIYIADNYTNELFLLDLTTGIRSVVSSESVGNGQMFEYIYNLVLDDENELLYATDGTGDAIFAIDINNGNRNVISDNSSGNGVGTGPEFNRLYGIAYHASSNVLYVADRFANAIFEVDISTGNRTILASAEVGTGPAVSSIYDLELDAENNRLLFASIDNAGLFALDLATLNRSGISINTTEEDKRLIRPLAISGISSGNNIYLADNLMNTIYEVDLSSGDREIVTRSNVGDGPVFELPGQLYLSPDSETLLKAHTGNGSILEVSLTTGDRTSLMAEELDNELNYFSDMCVDWNTNTAYILLVDSIHTLDLLTKERTLYIDFNSLEFDNLFLSRFIECDTDNNRLILFNGPDRYFLYHLGGGVLFYDAISLIGYELIEFMVLASGDDTIFAVTTDDTFVYEGVDGEGLGSIVQDASFPYATLSSFDVDLETGRFYTTNRRSPTENWESVITEWEQDGSYEIISGPGTGSGHIIIDGQNVVFDASNRRLLVDDSGLKAIVSVDIDTGDRIILSQ